MLIEQAENKISISRQCELLSVNRSTFYYKMKEKKFDDIFLMSLIDKINTDHPFYGRRKVTEYLRQEKGLKINVKKVDRLMTQMGLYAIYPKKNLSKPDEAHKKYPYLLRGISIKEPDHVWSTDITYVKLQEGFAYLCAVIDWYSRYVLAWRLSNTLDTCFCIEALEEALKFNTPEIFNTDQGCQFTSDEFTKKLLQAEIKISMDGRGRALDNIFVERLWRSVKYENIYPNCYSNMKEAKIGLNDYFEFYNKRRYHQSLKYKTPEKVYFQAQTKGVENNVSKLSRNLDNQINLEPSSKQDNFLS